MSVARTSKSSIGAKWVMALTGLGLLLFVIAHMLGNLQVFTGRDKLNSYAEGLQRLGPLLWAARLGLLAMFGIHVVTALRESIGVGEHRAHPARDAQVRRQKRDPQRRPVTRTFPISPPGARAPWP